MIYIESGKQHLYQWDNNQRLVIDNADITEVHFENAETANAYVCGVYFDDNKYVADIPNILLQSKWNIKAFGYSGESVCEAITIDVKGRDKPDDYTYTETEVKRYDTLEALIRDNYYDKATIDAKIPENMDMTNYYTKAEVDALIPPYAEEVSY